MDEAIGNYWYPWMTEPPEATFPAAWRYLDTTTPGQGTSYGQRRWSSEQRYFHVIGNHDYQTYSAGEWWVSSPSVNAFWDHWYLYQPMPGTGNFRTSTIPDPDWRDVEEGTTPAWLGGSSMFNGYKEGEGKGYLWEIMWGHTSTMLHLFGMTTGDLYQNAYGYRGTNGAHADYQTLRTTPQWYWLYDELQASTQTWKIVLGHDAPYCSGNKAQSGTYAGSGRPMRDFPLATWGADLYMAGHDHSFEHAQTDSMDFITVGNSGGQDSPTGPAADNNAYPLDYLTVWRNKGDANELDPGCVLVTVTSSYLLVEYYTVQSEHMEDLEYSLDHSFSITK